MNDTAQLWADPRLVYTVATIAVALLIATVWLFRRRRQQGRQAGVICLVMSIILHIALIVLVPMIPGNSGGSMVADPDSDAQVGVESVEFSTFDPSIVPDDFAGDEEEAALAPLPVSDLADLVQADLPSEQPEVAESAPVEDTSEEIPADAPPSDAMPETLAMSEIDLPSEVQQSIDSQFADWLTQEVTATTPEPAAPETPPEPTPQEPTQKPAAAHITDMGVPAKAVSTTKAPPAMVPGSLEADFANRVGQAKSIALARTGGDVNTEAAVEAALKFLANSQRADGAWDPRASGAGKERRPLGMDRGGAGSRAETAITGLALLTLMGAGQTHQEGEYKDNVFRGLAYLIRGQKPDGSLAGNAAFYAANYSHGMASLAMCEAAAITKDESAIASARRAISKTLRMQHPSTGGWRYTAGDPGDLSQLGWQAMVLDAGHRARIKVDSRAVVGVQRFLRSVRAGRGGLASYRPGEAASRTMTAEALATRLLIGESVPAAEIREAEEYLLQSPPGVGQDNYYYWYYATLALHQLQDPAWQQWNAALKQRLLKTQLPDGSWPADSVWGGYGGKVYTTSMATLCLETYYRHALRSDNDRIANLERTSVASPSTR